MKKIPITILAIIICNTMIAQSSGNINYSSTGSINNKYNNQQSRNVTSIGSISERLITVSAKGLINLKADSYVAIFSLTQNGNTVEEVNEIMTSRIKKAIDNIKVKTTVKTFVDMVSFVPIYSYTTEKKIFSKTTHNEIPAGFELKKTFILSFLIKVR